MSAPAGFNYAHEVFGIHSVAAASIFAVIYAFLLPYYLFRVIRNPTYVLIILSLFCAIRVTAFVMRAVLAGSKGAGTNLGLCIGESVVYSVGFFGLLYSTYTLVLDREILSGRVMRNPISRITANRHLIRLALTGAVAVGITGATYYSSSDKSNQDLGNTLRRVSAIIFLVVTALLALHTLFLIRRGGVSRHGLERGSVGTTHGMHVLAAIIVFLLIRQVYLTVTVGKMQNENVWYPLAALTELLAVLLFVTPGLVPDKKDVMAQQNQYEKDPETTEMT